MLKLTVSQAVVLTSLTIRPAALKQAVEFHEAKALDVLSG
jgi:hypothetical protein